MLIGTNRSGGGGGVMRNVGSVSSLAGHDLQIDLVDRIAGDGDVGVDHQRLQPVGHVLQQEVAGGVAVCLHRADLHEHVRNRHLGDRHELTGDAGDSPAAATCTVAVAVRVVSTLFTSAVAVTVSVMLPDAAPA